MTTILHRWQHSDDWSAHEFGLVVHAEIVRIHPFVDGNGRTTRLLADLVFAAAQEPGPTYLYDWHVDKRPYIDSLRAYDIDRAIRALARVVGQRPIVEE